MQRLLIILMMLTMAVGNAYGFSGGSKPAADAITLMPDTDFVLVADVDRVVGTKLFAEFEEISRNLVTKISAKEMSDVDRLFLEEIKSIVDVRQLRQMALGFSAQRFVYIVNGTIDQNRLMAALTSRADKITITSETYNGVKINLITGVRKSGEKLGNKHRAPFDLDTFALSFPTADTVVAGNIEGVKAALDVQAGKSAGLNKELLDLVNNPSLNAAVRFATTDLHKLTRIGPHGGDLQEKREAPANNNYNDPTKAIQSFSGGLDFQNGLSVDLRLTGVNEEAAQELSQKLNGGLALGKMALGNEAKRDPKQAKLLEVINLVAISVTGRDIKISANIHEPLMNELITMLKSEIFK